MTTVPTPSDSQDGARRRDDAANSPNGAAVSGDDTGSMDLRERLAAIEHERWADWQRYMHSQCRPLIGAGDALVIPEGLVERWERQIATTYADLSETEKDSDRQQVDRYWPLVADLLADVARLEAERDEARVVAAEAVQVLLRIGAWGLHASKQRELHIEALGLRDRLAAVDQTAPSSPLETSQAADGGEAGVVEGAGGSEAAEGVGPFGIGKRGVMEGIDLMAALRASLERAKAARMEVRDA